MRTLTSERHHVALSDTECVECASIRLREMDDFHLRSAASQRRRAAAEAPHPFLATFVAAFADPDGVDNGYVAIDRTDLTVRRGEIIHEAHCSQAAQDAPASPPQQSGYRARAVSDYFADADLAALSNPVAGVLAATAHDDLASLVTAKVAGFTVRHGEHGSYIRSWGGHTPRFGDSRHAGLIEGIERICCADPAKGDVLARVPEAMRAVAPRDFGLAPELWPLADPTIGAWTLGVDLSDGEPVALPTRTVFFDADIDEPVYVQDSSNGCAAGGSPAEAQLYGLLETIERDAFLLAWHGDLPLRRVDPATITDPDAVAYLQRLALVGRTVHFVDATVGVEVPTVIAVCDTASGGVCVGAGCHPDPERALLAALVEVASDFDVIEAHLGQRRAELERMLSDPHAVVAVEDHADLYGLPAAAAWLTRWAQREAEAPLVPLAELRRSDQAGADVETDLRLTVDAVERAGYRAIAVDVSSSISRRYGLACVKVVVPGLLPLDFGWHTQRALRMPRLREQCERWLQEHAPHAPSFQPHLRPHPFP